MQGVSNFRLQKNAVSGPRTGIPMPILLKEHNDTGDQKILIHHNSRPPTHKEKEDQDVSMQFFAHDASEIGTPRKNLRINTEANNQTAKIVQEVETPIYVNFNEPENSFKTKIIEMPS